MEVKLPIRIEAKVRKIFNALFHKERIVLVGSYRAYQYQLASPCLRYNYQGHSWKKNLLTDPGKDAIMRRLGNMSGGGYITQIGTGDSTTVATVGQTDLQAVTNKAWKALTPSTDINYIRPTLFAQVNFGFTENNWVWNELAIRDNNNVMWARQVDGTPINKLSSFAATVEWQIEAA